MSVRGDGSHLKPSIPDRLFTAVEMAERLSIGLPTADLLLQRVISPACASAGSVTCGRKISNDSCSQGGRAWEKSEL